MTGLYKAELIHAKRLWESVAAVELATMRWVHWWNTTRLHSRPGCSARVGADAGVHRGRDVVAELAVGPDPRGLGGGALWFAATVYERSILRTGKALTWREVLR